LSGIFVSYRRNDSQGEAGRLFDDLVQEFGQDMVFMDVAAIEAGRDFRKAIEEGVTKCGVLLVVIGLEWLNAKDERGARRLDDPADFVRIETASALRRDIPVIPVLVRGAKMPSTEQLPDDLKELAYRNCIELTHARWKSDLQLLLEALRRLVAGQRTSGSGVNAVAVQTTELAMPLARPAASLDPDLMERVRQELAHHIGPIASIVVNRAVSHCASADELYSKVAEEIDSLGEREQFLRRVTSSPNALSVAAKPITERVVTQTAKTQSAATPAESTPVPVPESSAPNQEKLEHAVADTISEAIPRRGDARPAKGWKYGMLAVAAIIVLTVVALILLSSRSRTRPASQDVSVAPAHASAAVPVAPSPLAASAVTNRPALPVERPDREKERIAARRFHVSPEVARSLLISEVRPDYPRVAVQAFVQGTVLLDVDISKEGMVENLKATSGHPLLVPAALDAVKQWRYKPFMLDGKAAAFSTQVEVHFSLH
jgi:TonB family protein